MRKTIVTFFFYCCLPQSILAFAEANVVGVFLSKPGVAGSMKVLCVKAVADSRVEAHISAGVCPSEACLNYRPADFTFEGMLKRNMLHYSDSTGCDLKISFGNRGATIKQSDQCRNDDNPYLYANGFYKFVKPDLDEGICGQ